MPVPPANANGPQVWQAVPVAHVLPAYLHPIGDQNASAWALARAQAVKVGPIVGPQDNGLAVDHAGFDRLRRDQ